MRADNPLKVDGQAAASRRRATPALDDVIVLVARQPPTPRCSPRFSVILLTTLIGAGQGLFLALFLAELCGRVRLRAGADRRLLRARRRRRAGADRRRAGRVVLPPRPARSAPGARPRSGAPRGCRAR
ncbi:MAG: hypothetical protein MZV65_33235 [Chromatiales bacterium]|nr:hypothetical protein [Chromatiales bacterium]